MKKKIVFLFALFIITVGSIMIFSGKCNNIFKRINNPSGCEAVIINETLAGISMGGSEFSLSKGENIVVYFEIDNQYMLLRKVANEFVLPVWVKKSDVSIK